MNEKQVIGLLSACFYEFCSIVGDSPCVCDACPYSEYNTDENVGGCHEEYIKDKLCEVDPVDAEPIRRGSWKTGSIALVPGKNEKFFGKSLYACSECCWECACEGEVSFKYCPNCGAKMDMEEK